MEAENITTILFKNESYNISSWLLNQSINFDPVLVTQYMLNRKVDEPAFQILIAMYCLLIIFGATGNTLVIWKYSRQKAKKLSRNEGTKSTPAPPVEIGLKQSDELLKVVSVARKPAMRTARNIFIVNLAVSDLLLCVVTMPLTLVEILTKYWPLGQQSVVCKMIGTLQATSIFVSTISITAIALDRYQVIVYPTKESLQLMGAGIILSLIWISALILASPMFLYRTLNHHQIKLAPLGIDGISFCVEDWPVEHGRAYYSIFTLVVQYVLPILIVSMAYLRIYYKLRYRYATGYVGNENASSSRRALRGRRLQRTNILLVSIAIIFGISWLPLNLFNLLADLWGSRVTQNMIVGYAICHMIGMSSACSNPLLYGWLNDNFRKEFYDLLCNKEMLDRTETQRLSTMHGSMRDGSRKKVEAVTVATDCLQGNTVDTEMTVISK